MKIKSQKMSGFRVGEEKQNYLKLDVNIGGRDFEWDVLILQVVHSHVKTQEKDKFWYVL